MKDVELVVVGDPGYAGSVMGLEGHDVILIILIGSELQRCWLKNFSERNVHPSQHVRL